MKMPPLWRLARPWTPSEWKDIVDSAQKALHHRSTAKALRQSDRDQAEINYWHARGYEARLVSYSEVRGRDLDWDRVDAYENDSRTERRSQG